MCLLFQSKIALWWAVLPADSTGVSRASAPHLHTHHQEEILMIATGLLITPTYFILSFRLRIAHPKKFLLFGVHKAEYVNAENMLVCGGKDGQTLPPLLPHHLDAAPHQAVREVEVMRARRRPCWSVPP